MTKHANIVAVIPAYNEEDTIKDTIDSLLNIKLIDDVVVIDDGSTDNTAQIAISTGIQVISLDKNYGKGFAIKKAIEEVNFEYLVLVDGDLGKSSREILKLIDPVINDEADFTIAKFKPASKKGGVGLVKKLAKFGVSSFSGHSIDTTLSGQRAYKRKVVEQISYIPNNFGVEVAMTIGALKAGFNVKEVDVDMTHRETDRDINGFIHRGKQFFDISLSLIMLLYKR